MRWVHGNIEPGNCNEITSQTISQNDYQLNASDYLEGDFNGDGVSEVIIRRDYDNLLNEKCLNTYKEWWCESSQNKLIYDK